MKALTFILILFVTSSFSQTLSTKIGKTNINFKLLNELIIKEVNFQRSSRNIPIIPIGESAMQYSKKHTSWMIREDKFEHSNLSNGAECIQEGFQYQEKTYDETAKGIVKIWMDSPKHREIILTDFKYACNIGVDVGIDTNAKTLCSLGNVYKATLFIYIDSTKK